MPISPQLGWPTLGSDCESSTLSVAKEYGLRSRYGWMAVEGDWVKQLVPFSHHLHSPLSNGSPERTHHVQLRGPACCPVKNRLVESTGVPVHQSAPMNAPIALEDPPRPLPLPAVHRSAAKTSCNPARQAVSVPIHAFPATRQPTATLVKPSRPALRPFPIFPPNQCLGHT